MQEPFDRALVFPSIQKAGSKIPGELLLTRWDWLVPRLLKLDDKQLAARHLYWLVREDESFGPLEDANGSQRFTPSEHTLKLFGMHMEAAFKLIGSLEDADYEPDERLGSVLSFVRNSRF